MAVKTIEPGVVVSLAYTLTVEGEVIEDASADAPLDYLHGANNIVPGLEAALAGKSVGDKFSITVQPAEGYGEYDTENIEEFSKEELGDDADSLEAGMVIVLEDEEGEMFEGVVTEVRADSVLLDFNDSLAGKVLDYQVEVVGLRPATEEELEQGYPDSYLDDYEYEEE